MQRGAGDDGRAPQKKRPRLDREAFGDPGEIGGFKGPWSSFTGVPEREDPMRAKDELSLKRIVNKHCLTEGRERSRSSGPMSMEGHLNPSRNLVGRFVIPKNNTMVFHDHRDTVTSVRLLERFQLALSSSLDGKVHLYSLKNKGLATTYMGHSKAVMSAVPSKDEDRFNTISLDCFLKGWDVESGRCDVRIDVHSPLACQTPQTLGGVVFVGCLDGRIRCLDLRDKKVSREIGGGGSTETSGFRSDSLVSICAAELDNVLVSSTRDGSLCFWDLRRDEVLRTYKASYSFIELNRDRRQATVVCEEKAEFFCTVSQEQSAQAVKVPGCSTRAMSPGDGYLLCYGRSDGTVRVVDLRSMDSATLGHTSERVSSIDWIGGSSSNLISGNILGNIGIWE